ncbi:MAG: sigma-70 family RNA polymerase sigma factor [Prevotellaceae bacterium]|jgi:RNA polymerase sigma-70 factor (ECF subfamily)|nr:sigma-70 family RNA polymerase sigma factor [Prevotellaceae bacterium]
MEHETVQELVACSKRGDTQAFGKLVAAFQSLAFRLAFRLLCNGEDARDVVQEVFVKAWLQLGRYNPQYRFSTWIYKITCNLCYDKLRAKSRSPEVAGALLSSAPLSVASSEQVEAAIVNRELKELILYLTERLSPKQKLVFTLSDIEGLEAGEVEEITGLSAGQIKSNLHLARKYIRSKINAVAS